MDEIQKKKDFLVSQDMLNDFLVESSENLNTLQESLISLRNNSQDSEQINAIYRAIHTLKGSARLFHFEKLQELSHVTEGLLSMVRDSKIRVNPMLLDLLEEVTDRIQSFLAYIENNGQEGELHYHDLQSKIFLIQEGGDKEPVIEELHLVKESKETVPQNFQSLPQEKSPRTISIHQKEDSPPSDGGAALSLEGDSPSTQSKITSSFVRVSTELLDKLMNQVGELVLNRNQLLQFAGLQKQIEFSTLVQQLNIITSELQENIMATRMQPLSSVLVRFERIVRDLAREQGKNVRYELEGEETELDKSLIEAIKDPLTHIVRNSIDHGIEVPALRKERGKPEEGILKIKAFHEGGQVVIEIRDDGKGLDSEALLKKAVEKGVVTHEEGQSLDRNAIFDLIFKPGFSTAEAVTQISGRGVGMDVVKKNIEKIGGSTEIKSELGQGTILRLKIPLTLAIVSALIVEIKGRPFAITQSDIQELVRLDLEEDHSALRMINRRPFLMLRDKLIPLFCSKLYFSLEKEEQIMGKGLLNIVIINCEGMLFGMLVDLIRNTEEIVVKPFGRGLRDLPIFAGATIMGDGDVALIIDAPGFFELATKGLNLKDLASQQVIVQEDDKEISGEYQENLLFQLDKESSLFAVNLSLVYRLEEIDLEKIEWSGDRPIYRYLDKAMPLIDLPQCLELGVPILEAKNLREQINREDGLIDCIVVHVKGKLYGLLVRKILDISHAEVDIDINSSGGEEILGTFFLEDKLINLLQPYVIIDDLFKGHTQELSLVQELEGRKILVVDDSLMYRKLSEEACKELGAIVTTAIDGEEALKICKKEVFDLILTDIEMPKLDGYQFCHQMRSLGDRYQNIPVIAVSTKVSPDDRLKGSEAGFSSHLEKFRKEEVIKEIKRYLIS